MKRLSLLILLITVPLNLLTVEGVAEEESYIGRQLEYAKMMIGDHGISKIGIIVLTRMGTSTDPYQGGRFRRSTAVANVRKEDVGKWLDLISSYVPEEVKSSSSVFLSDVRIMYEIYSNNQNVLSIFIGQGADIMMLNGIPVKRDDRWFEIILPYLDRRLATSMQGF